MTTTTRKPYNKSTGRDYKSDYSKFQSSPKAIKERASRNKARATLAKAGRVHKGDGKDVDHKNGNPLDNKKSNWQVMSKSRNRAKH